MVVVDGEPRVGVQLAPNHVPTGPMGHLSNRSTSTCRSRTSRPPTIVSCRWGRRCSSRRRTSTPPTTSRSTRILPGIRSVCAGFKDASSRKATAWVTGRNGKVNPVRCSRDTWACACSTATYLVGNVRRGDLTCELSARPHEAGAGHKECPLCHFVSHNLSRRVVVLTEMATICPASAPRRTGKRPELVRSVEEKKRWSDALMQPARKVTGASESNS